MKKSLLAVVAMLVVTATVWAATNQVSSVNVAGYLKLTVQRGLNQIRNDFICLAGDPTTQNVLGDQLPVNTRVYLWRPGVGGGYSQEIYEEKWSGGFPPVYLGNEWNPGTNHLDPGRGFWLQIPNNAPQPTYTLNLLGEVPSNPTSTIPITYGLNMIGYSYPVDVVLSNLDLTAKAAVGDRIYKWNGSGYDQNIYQEIWSGGFPPVLLGTDWAVPSMQIKVGQGLWYQRNTAGTVNWVEDIPYDLGN